MVALGLALFVGAPLLNAKEDAKTTHDGKVVSITKDKLVMTGKDDKEHTHALNADVKFTLDTKVCKCEEIKEGMKIRVTTKNDAKSSVTWVEAIDKDSEFEKRDK